MAPLIVHLDTEVFDAAELNLTGTKFKALLEYCKQGRTRLVMTSVTKREVKRHIREQVSTAGMALKQASAEWWFIKNLPGNKFHVVTEKPNKKELDASTAAAFEEFLTDAKAEIISLSNADAEEIFDRYFGATPPFSEGKKKSELPDAFAIQVLERWAEDHDESGYVVSRDKDWQKSCTDKQTLLYLPTLDSFLDLVTRQDMERHENVLQLYRQNSAKIIDAIRRDFPDRGFYLSGEDGDVEEVEVNSVGLDPEADIISITDLGEATITTLADIKFTARITVNDVANGAFDKEDGRWIVLPTKSGSVTRNESVPVEITIYLSEDGRSIEDLHCSVEVDDQIELDYSEWENWPCDLDDDPEENNAT